MPSVAELPNAWRAEAKRIRERYASEALAALCEAHALDLERTLQAADEQFLTPAQAAADPDVLWDSADHVALQVRRGKIRNYGEKHSPRVRRGDLPRKPKPMSSAPAEPSQTDEDAPPSDEFSLRAISRAG